MTFDEWNELEFAFAGRTSLSYEHNTTYQTRDGKFAYCVHVPYRNGEPKGRIRVHYRIGERIYKTQKAFEQALKEL